MAMHLDSYLGSLSLIFFFAWFLTSPAEAAMKKYQFDIKVKNVNRLCHAKPIVTVNGRFPGPTIFVREGDRVLVNVTNHAQYNMSSHWHGLKQFRNGWADGSAYVTQCPIKTEQSYTYNFNVTGQRGTLWWHAHILWLRATIYDTFAMEVEAGKTYLLRIINAALNDELFFAIAGYNMTVVEIDAIYTKPFTTRVILIAPASMNNITFVMPKIGLLQAHYFNIKEVFRTNFPDRPPVQFNYTGAPLTANRGTSLGTRLSKVAFNSTIELVLQDTNLLTVESHPFHLHGFNIFIVGSGVGNFNLSKDPAKFNLVDPLERNTVRVPTGGWTAIRFKADNPGCNKQKLAQTSKHLCLELKYGKMMQRRRE
ncbi:hypothetical protein SCA6_001682 [Theobroma cacao]